MAYKFSFLVLALALTLADVAQSEVSFEWVTVGDPGNPNDPLTDLSTPWETPPTRGAVPYVYRISKYETTIGQWAAFLNAVGKSNPDRARSIGGPSQLRSISGIALITTEGKDLYHVMHGGTSAYLPITFVEYLDAVRFVNWLHNAQGDGDTETGAYTISADGQVTRSPNARYWIPTENEWYKAAYYDPSPEGPADDYWTYPWRNSNVNSRPANYYGLSSTLGTYTYAVTGRPRFDPNATHIADVRSYRDTSSYYGTLNQAGNVEEWTEGDSFSGGPHTRGGHWQVDASGNPQWIFVRMASYTFVYSGFVSQGPGSDGIGFRIATAANPPVGGLKNGDKIRFHPRLGHGARMVGGVFEARKNNSYEVLHTITQVPPNGWTEVSVDFGEATEFRYRAPDGGHGNVAEVEFCRSGAKVIAAISGTPGSWSNLGSTFDKALDGDVATFFDAPEPNGAYVQANTGSGARYDTHPLVVVPANYDHLHVDVNGQFGVGTGDYQPGRRASLLAVPPDDGQYFAGWEGFTTLLDDPTAANAIATIPGTGTHLWLKAIFKPLPAGSHVLEVTLGSGDGVYPSGTLVTVSADPPRAGEQFAGWTGDIAILSNPFLAVTTALIPGMNVSIFATYSAVSSSDSIRFYPRLYHAARMIGGVFEGTNGDPINGPYQTIYTISSNPPLAWNDVEVDLKDYRYLRYRGSTESFGNVAEIEFCRDGAKLSGTGFGAPGSWSGQGSTFDKALDGNLDTFFDATVPTGAYVGIDTGSTSVPTDRIRFYPRLYHTARMVGGVFEGTNADPVNGPYQTIYTISSNPPLAWNEVEVDLKDYRYLRYRGPVDSFGNVAEIEFYRDGLKVTGQGFGTPGSWSGQGSTFDKALDGNLDTFFDAPINTGAYVGLGAP